MAFAQGGGKFAGRRSRPRARGERERRANSRRNNERPLRGSVDALQAGPSAGPRAWHARHRGRPPRADRFAALNVAAKTDLPWHSSRACGKAWSPANPSHLDREPLLALLALHPGRARVPSLAKLRGDRPRPKKSFSVRGTPTASADCNHPHAMQGKAAHGPLQPPPTRLMPARHLATSQPLMSPER